MNPLLLIKEMSYKLLMDLLKLFKELNQKEDKVVTISLDIPVSLDQFQANNYLKVFKV